MARRLATEIRHSLLSGEFIDVTYLNAGGIRSPTVAEYRLHLHAYFP